MEPGMDRGGRVNRGDMSADSTQTFVRLAEQGDKLPDSSSERERPSGLRKLLNTIWPFGKR